MIQTDVFNPTVWTYMDIDTRPGDLMSRDFNTNRCIHLINPINAQVAALINMQLHYLDEKSHEDITMIINCSGGDIPSGLSICETMMDGIESDIRTVISGSAAMMPAVIAACGTPGKRYISRLSEAAVHQPSYMAGGQGADISVLPANMLRFKKRIASMLMSLCNVSAEEIRRAMEADRWMDAKEAVEFGLADPIGLPSVERDDRV